VIVEPALMRLLFLANTVKAADEARTNTYGAVKEIPAKLNAALSSKRRQCPEVADAVLRIIGDSRGREQLIFG